MSTRQAWQFEKFAFPFRRCVELNFAVRNAVTRNNSVFREYGTHGLANKGSTDVFGILRCLLIVSVFINRLWNLLCAFQIVFKTKWD